MIRFARIGGFHAGRPVGPERRALTCLYRRLCGDVTVASGQTDYNVDAVTFVRTWQNAGSAQEVADALKMPKDIVHARASMYRGAGVKLKRMPRHSTKAIDVQALNKLIEEVDKEAGRRTPPAKKTSDIPDGPVLVGDTIKGILEKARARAAHCRGRGHGRAPRDLHRLAYRL